MHGQITIGDILAQYGESYITRNHIIGQEKGLIRLLSMCRSQAMGSHFERCDQYRRLLIRAVTGIAPLVSKRTNCNGWISVCRNYFP
jgi:hypothetical protein